MTIDKLISDLSERGGSIASSDDIPSSWVITNYQGKLITPPVLLRVTESDLSQWLEYASSDGADVFPDVKPSVGAYRLLLMHVDEVLAKDARPRELHISRQGVTTIPEKVTPVPVSPLSTEADLHWVAYPERSDS